MKRPRSLGRPLARVLGATWAMVTLGLAGCLPGGSEGERLYRRHCQECHGTDGGGGILYRTDEGADLLDDVWRYGGDRSSIASSLDSEVVSEHPTWEFRGEEIDALVDYVQEIRDDRR